MKKLLFLVLGSLFALSISAQTMLDTAINFSVKDTYGEIYELYPILDEGKMVVIDFFSTT